MSNSSNVFSKDTALIQQLTHDMIEARKVANKIEDQREKALAYHDTVAVYFDQIRKHVDRLEEIVDDQMWPLPKYRGCCSCGSCFGLPLLRAGTIIGIIRRIRRIIFNFVCLENFGAESM